MITLVGPLLAQESGLPFSPAVLGTATGMLCFFGWLMYRSMNRADTRVDSAADKVVAAAAAERDREVAAAVAERDRAIQGEQEAEGRWENERAARSADQAKYERLLRERDLTIMQLRADLAAEQRQYRTRDGRGKGSGDDDDPPRRPTREGPTRH